MPNVLTHTVISVGLAGGSYVANHNLPLAIGIIAVGVLVDADHVIDYWLGEKNEYKFYQMWCYAYQSKLRKVFHAWEWAVALMILFALIPDYRVAWILTSYGLHIIYDWLYWKKPVEYFSIIYRWKHGFSATL